jgi:hypothetical protein
MLTFLPVRYNGFTPQAHEPEVVAFPGMGEIVSACPQLLHRLEADPFGKASDGRVKDEHIRISWLVTRRAHRLNHVEAIFLPLPDRRGKYLGESGGCVLVTSMRQQFPDHGDRTDHTVLFLEKDMNRMHCWLLDPRPEPVLSLDVLRPFCAPKGEDLAHDVRRSRLALKEMGLSHAEEESTTEHHVSSFHQQQDAVLPSKVQRRHRLLLFSYNARCTTREIFWMESREIQRETACA